MLISRFAFLLIFCTALSANAVDLKQETIDAFNRYVATAESRIQSSYNGALRLPDSPQMRAGAVLVEPAQGNGLLATKGGGLIEDWIGAVFIPGAKLATTLAVAQDYPHHKDYYLSLIHI